MDENLKLLVQYYSFRQDAIINLPQITEMEKVSTVLCLLLLGNQADAHGEPQRRISCHTQDKIHPVI